MGFFEILLIAVVTLLVVGPEKMPEAVRSVALTIGRLKRTFNNARSEIEKHIGADEIRRQLHNEAIMESLEKIKGDIEEITNNDSAPKHITHDNDDWEEEFEDPHQYDSDTLDDPHNNKNPDA